MANNYLEKYLNLSKDIRKQISSPSNLKVFDDLEGKYNVDINEIIIRLAIKNISFAKLKSILISDYHLDESAAESVNEKLSNILGAILGAEKPNLLKENDMESVDKEAKQIEKEMPKIIRQDNISQVVIDIIKATGLIFSSDVLTKRFKNIIISYLKDVRDEIGVKEILMRNPKIGGLGLGLEKANEIIDILEEKKINIQTNTNQKKIDKSSLSEGLKSPEEIISPKLKNIEPVSRPIPPTIKISQKIEPVKPVKQEEKFLSKIAQTKKSSEAPLPLKHTEPLNISNTVQEQPMKIKQPAPLKNLPSPKEETKENKKITLGEKNQKEKIESQETEGLGQLQKKLEIAYKKEPEEPKDKKEMVEIPEKKSVEKINHPAPKSKESYFSMGAMAPLKKVSPPESSKEILISKKEPKIIKSSVNINRPTQVSSFKPKVEEIKITPKIYGPIDELRAMKLKDFRGFGTSEKAIEHLKDKINLLGEESLSKKAQGIKAWKQSEVNQLYIKIGTEAIENGKSILEIITSRSKDNKPVLSMEEFNAIAKLNKTLRV